MPDPWLRHSARMVVASLIGFAVAAQFISLWALELPYYTAMIGAITIKLTTRLGNPDTNSGLDAHMAQ